MSAPVPSPSASLLLPYQGQWVASGLRRGWKLRIAEKSRRIGVTWAEAFRQVLLAAGGDCNCYYVSTSQILGRDFIDTAAMWARGMEKQRPGQVLDRVLADKIVFRSGRVLQAVTSSPRALRGKGGDVVVDEAAHHVDLEAMLKAASAVGKWTPYGLTLISTHNGAENLFATTADEVREGRRRGILKTVDLEAACSAGLYRRICSVNRMRWAPELEAAWIADAYAEPGSDEEYKCIPARGGGVYFRRDLLERRTLADEVPIVYVAGALGEDGDEEAIRRWCADNLDPVVAGWPDLPIYLGVDFARSADGDLSVFAVLAERQDLSRAVVSLVELRGVPYETQWSILRWLVNGAGSRLGAVRLDGASNGGYLAEKAVNYLGEPFALGVSMSLPWKVQHFGRARADLEEGRLWIPRDLDVLRDFGIVRMGPQGVPIMPDKRATKCSRDGGKRHGDAAVAIIAALSGTEADVEAGPVGGDDGSFDDDFDMWPRGGRGTGLL